MSNSGSNDSINLDLIDLNSSSSDPSSGEFYEPSSGVLRRARDTIERTDELLGSTRYFLRNRASNLNPEHQTHKSFRTSKRKRKLVESARD